MRLSGFLAVLSFAVLITASAEARLLLQGENASSVAFDFSSSDPGANAELTQPPTKVTLTFTDTLNPDETHITVTDPYGNIISSGSVTASDKQASVDVTPPDAKLANGSYNVQWSAICHCSDTFANGAPITLNGNFGFHVQTPEPNQTVTPPATSPTAPAQTGKP